MLYPKYKPLALWRLETERLTALTLAVQVVSLKYDTKAIRLKTDHSDFHRLECESCYYHILNFKHQQLKWHFISTAYLLKKKKKGLIWEEPLGLFIGKTAVFCIPGSRLRSAPSPACTETAWVQSYLVWKRNVEPLLQAVKGAFFTSCSHLQQCSFVHDFL